MTRKTTRLTLFADGGSRGNPGPSAAGFLLYDEKKNVIAEGSKFLGQATNNTAEYLAVVYGLQEALFQGAEYLKINLDSELIVKQLKGEYRVKDQTLKYFFDQAMQLMQYFKEVSLKHIPREENKEADKLVNQALNLGGYKKPETTTKSGSPHRNQKEFF